MADGLFLMQRYYGSDEESRLITSKLEKKQRKLIKSRKKPKDAENEIDSLPCNDPEKLNVEVCNPRYFENKEKKKSVELKKRKKVSDVENLSPPRSKVKKQSKVEVNSSTNLGSMNGKKSNNQIKRKNDIGDSADNEAQSSLCDDAQEPKVSLENRNETFCVIGPKNNQNILKVKPNLPKWIKYPSVISIDLKKKEIPILDLTFLDDCSKKNLIQSGIDFLFPVQLAVIPWLMVHNHHSFIRPHDLCVSAPTGSGKTLAFVLPIVQSLRGRTVCAIRAVVVLPVSELALQVYKVFEVFIKNTDLKVVLLTGQKSFQAEQKALTKQGTNGILTLADIVVTTPGRILDHIQKTEGFTLQHLKYLVIDEADRMVVDILKGWLVKIQEAVFKYSSRTSCACSCFSICDEKTQFGQSTACSFGHTSHSFQKLLYSATLSHDPEKLHSLSLYRPKLFIAKEKMSLEDDFIGGCLLPEKLSLKYTICKTELKPLVLCHFIKKYQFKKILCFIESVEKANRLQLILEEMRLVRSKEISSNYRPVQRKIILKQFNSGKIDLIVCSDLVARGIDIEGVDCVVSYDVPPFLKTYIHRVGRTARAGKEGTSITLISKDEFPNFKKMLSDANMALPSNLDINVQDLKEYADTFQKALQAADLKFRKQKNSSKRTNSSKKMHRGKSTIKTL